MKKFLLGILWKLLLVVLGFFVVTFTMYLIFPWERSVSLSEIYPGRE